MPSRLVPLLAGLAFGLGQYNEVINLDVSVKLDAEKLGE